MAAISVADKPDTPDEPNAFMKKKKKSPKKKEKIQFGKDKSPVAGDKKKKNVNAARIAQMSQDKVI